MTGAIARYGVIGIFVLMVPESACIPVPSEVTLLFSGFGVREGWISFPLAVLAATAGNVVGSLLAYGVGASHTLARLPAAHTVLNRWGGMLDRHGLRAVFLARLLPLARTFVSLPAGARRLPLVPFVVLTMMGCALWAAVLLLIGVAAGGGWATASSTLGRALLLVGLVAIAWPAMRRRRRR